MGQTAPDFELVNQFGEPVRLSSLRGRNVVVVFYPFAFSGICTVELGQIRDNVSLFENSNAIVLAVSTDSKFTLRAFAEKGDYGFELLSDFWPHGAVAEKYGVFDSGSGMAQRGTFIIDAGGIIRYVVLNRRGQARDLSGCFSVLAELCVPAGLDQC